MIDVKGKIAFTTYSDAKTGIMERVDGVVKVQAGCLLGVSGAVSVFSQPLNESEARKVITARVWQEVYGELVGPFMLLGTIAMANDRCGGETLDLIRHINDLLRRPA